VIPLDMAALDRDGALAEAEAGLTRGRLLGLGALAGAGVLLGRPGSARAAVGAGDRAVLNYALSLEYLQAAFYTESERSKALTGRAAEAARHVGAVERAHVHAFLGLLGRHAIKRPRFDFQGVTEDRKKFLKTAVAFEDLAVEAYKGQAIKIRSKAVLASALGIHTVEARHAAWMRYLNGIQPAVSAFDSPRPKAQIDVIVRRTGFITGAPHMSAHKRPDYTG
jgi:Ferritin-like domain